MERLAEPGNPGTRRTGLMPWFKRENQRVDFFGLLRVTSAGVDQCVESRATSRPIGTSPPSSRAGLGLHMVASPFCKTARVCTS